MPAQAMGWRTPKRCVERVAIDGMVDVTIFWRRAKPARCYD
jgi:hypothetical protein